MHILSSIVKFSSAYMLADFITGLYHWAEDNYETWPRNVLCHNRYHHLNPKAMIQYGSYWNTFIDTFRYSCVLLLPIWYLDGGPVWYFTIIIGSTANVIHSFTHVPREQLPMSVIFLQNWGIFQSPYQHRIHHTGKQNTNYCVMTNYLNPVLEYINFWRRLEFVVEKITGFKAMAKTDKDIVQDCVTEGTLDTQYGPGLDQFKPAIDRTIEQ